MMNKSHIFVIFLAFTLILPSTEGFGHIRKHAKMVGKAVGTTARMGFILPILKAKGIILAAPLAIPLAIGAKMASIGAMAIPAATGALIGAPIGAIVGAKVGAIKGAALGKMLLLKKLALMKLLFAKKVALGLKAFKIGALIAAKPILIVAGLKTAIIAKKAALLAKTMAIAGKGIAVGGKTLSHGGVKITALTTHLHSLVHDKVSNLVQHVSHHVAVPVMPALPVVSVPAVVPVIHKPKGPISLDFQYVIDTPMTGPKYGKALIMGNLRKKREAEAPSSDSVMPAININQLISFVQKSNAQQCLARVICELSANPNVLGVEGIKFGTSLLTMSRVNHPGTSQYRTASIVGSRSRNPSTCTTRFPQCSTESSEVVRVGNNLING